MSSEQNDYLWDPAATPDADVAAVEHALAGLRFDPSSRPLSLPARARRRFVRPVAVLAVAASLLLAAGAGFWTWRQTWPAGRAWTLESHAAASRIEVGREVTLPAGENAVANIGRIGTMRIAGGTSFELRATRDTRHRLRLTDGRLHVRVWAPPVSVVVETPSGDVIDMGCEFVLEADAGRSAVTVLSGWVQMENTAGSVMIPAGASSAMTAGAAPSVPVFDDAPEAFRDAARRIARDGSRAVDDLVRFARARDVYTLLQLARRHPEAAEALLRRAAELAPPPGDVTIGRILRGDRRALWAWTDALPLPPPKKWWRHWRDAIPLGLR